MTTSIRRTAFVLIAMLGILGLGLTYQQTLASADYQEDVRNPRTILERAERPRGSIHTADGILLAESVPSGLAAGTYLRNYPEGADFAHITGYSTSVFGDTGLERVRKDDLSSADDESLRALVLEALGAEIGASDLRLTIRADLQRAAIEALDGQQGAVVALDPATGAVLAMVSVPSFDPNTLVGEDALDAGNALTDDPSDPLLNRAISQLYPPGSTFKLITASAGLGTDFVRPDTRLADTDELELPTSTSTITNFDGEFCGNGEWVTLSRALAISCNTAFADLGMRIGAEDLVAAAEDAGWNREIPFDLTTVAAQIPSSSDLGEDLPAIAQTALGQRDVRTTPLQMALVAAAVANDGVMMTPHLVAEVAAADGSSSTPEPIPWRRAMSEETAADLEDMMKLVVSEGSGWRAQIPGITLAGKTGTAEVPDRAPDVWFVAYGPADSEPGEPQVVVAVLVEAGGFEGEDATGGRVASPIARQVIETWLQG